MGSGILVYCEHDNGVIKKTAYELLGKATALSGDGGAVTAVLVGSADAADLGSRGATRVLTVTGAGFERFNTEPVTRALEAAVGQVDPAVLLGSASPGAREVFPRLAARLGAGMITEVTGLEMRDGSLVGTRPIYAGKVLVESSTNTALSLITVRPNSFPTPAPQGGEAEVVSLEVSLTDDDQRATVQDVVQSVSDVADLTEAERIVAGGRSLKSTEGFDEIIVPLAKVLGATPGASRAAVDAGYVPHSWQVGQTGKVVNPTLYIACGISGAIQHLAGMRTSKVIVAINKDPDAPIFQHATYGIVDDLFEVVPVLTRALAETLS